MSLHSPTAWLHCPKPSPSARLRLYAFPFAGGGASVFFPWAAALAPEIEVWAVRLPGRETRLREPALTSFAATLAALQREVAPRLRPPYSFFGHSLGALVAFAFAQELQRRAAPLPETVIVAGARGPDLPDPESPIGGLPDAAFFTELRDRYNGIPPAVLAHPELLELVLPLLRADIRLYEDFRHTPGPPLPCHLAAFGGKSDPIVSADGLAAWRAQTSGAFQTQLFDGDHFFLQSSATAVLAAVKRCLAAPPR
jgi:medium-chain acyl-[acyl-carrier-protein] hydrolase